MAFVHPKCVHGRKAIQLFYETSYVCPDECLGIASPPKGRPTFEQMRQWHEQELCSFCGRSTRNVYWCTVSDRADHCGNAYDEWGHEALRESGIM